MFFFFPAGFENMTTFFLRDLYFVFHSFGQQVFWNGCTLFFPWNTIMAVLTGAIDGKVNKDGFINQVWRLNVLFLFPFDRSLHISSSFLQLCCSVSRGSSCVRVCPVVSHFRSDAITLPTVCRSTQTSPAAMVTCFLLCTSPSPFCY